MGQNPGSFFSSQERKTEDLGLKMVTNQREIFEDAKIMQFLSRHQERKNDDLKVDQGIFREMKWGSEKKTHRSI